MKQLMINNHIVEVTKDAPADMIEYKVNAVGREDKDDAFFIADLGDIVRKLRLWHTYLPRVEPFYAVKCNDDPVVLALLAQLGIGFDCASKSEISRMLDLKVASNRIVYANPCKQNSHIRYAAKNNVQLMTFDNETELHKVKASFPDAKLLVRILPPDGSKCQCELGNKYGVASKRIPKLLKIARDLELSVVGVSFHVGSGCYDATAFSAAVALARAAFNMGEEAGYHFEMLDIGGGFPGNSDSKVSFEEICSVLRPALDMYFPETMGVRVIAEPGRYFVASAFTLSVNIIAKRIIPRDVDENEEMTGDLEPKFMYYVNDGVYGSFNCLLYDHATVKPLVVHADDYEGHPLFKASVWGPTCDGLDCINDECDLPEMDAGSWLYFSEMGAYTMCAASNFNGMPKPRCYYTVNDATLLSTRDNAVDTGMLLKSGLGADLCTSPQRECLLAEMGQELLNMEV